MSGNGPMTGKVFSSRYEIGERIGVGGMAEVYSAQDNVLGRVVAVKVMLPQFAEDPDFRRRFRQEAAAAANLQSPYIVNVYDWGHDDDTYYIVMEYVRGSDLKTAIEQRGAINQKKVAEIGSQVCQALSVAHQQDIIHRDIKPQNIMVQPDGNVKVMDFGIARAKNSTADKTQTVLGTAHYTSPEQAQGKDLTAASDIYSLGVVLYEAATGTLPFDGPDAVSVALMQVQDFAPNPREVNPNISPELEKIIMTAMEKNPNKRFATANDMRLALNDFLAGRPVSTDGFTSAATSVIAPMGAAASAADATQVMPITRTMDPQSTSVMPVTDAARKYQNSFDGNDSDGKKKGPIIALIAVIAILAIAGAAFAFMGGGEKIPVPNVIGMTQEEAITAIEAAGFTVGNTDSMVDESVEPGTVINQNPKEGEEAAKGSKINIIIAQGSDELEIPSVTGMTLDEARKTLVTEGFVVGDVQNEYSDTVEADHVISQSPTSGQKAPKGSKINLVVSQGEDQVTVPNIEGLSLDAAERKAADVGLTLTKGGSENSTWDKDTIISQSPASGTKVSKGTSISYVISLGPADKSVTVSNVVGMDEEAAQEVIRGQGFSVRVKTEKSNKDAGTVISQSPTKGVPGEDTVTIVVSLGPDGGSGTNSTD